MNSAEARDLGAGGAVGRSVVPRAGYEHAGFFAVFEKEPEVERHPSIIQPNKRSCNRPRLSRLRQALQIEEQGADVGVQLA